MIRTSIRLSVYLSLMCCALMPLMAQTAASFDSVVPGMVKFAGILNDASGKPLTGTVGVTFLLYTEQSGGSPLWMETQNVQADKTGHYSVMLGSATSHGIPAKAFAAGEARWLGVQPSGQAEQPRVVLASVPYALKALDAETLGGRPASSFLRAPAAGAKGTSQAPAPPADQPNEIVCASGTACRKGFIPLFATHGGSAKVKDSIVTQEGTAVTVAGDENVNGNIGSGGDIAVGGTLNANQDVNVTGLLRAGGVQASTASVGDTTTAISGIATATGNAGFTFGVVGQSKSDKGRGVFGLASGILGVGVIGEVDKGGVGVSGKVLTGSPSGQGVVGESFGNQIDGNGVGPDGVDGISHSDLGSGVAAVNTAGGDGLFAQSSTGFAAFFLGDVEVDGTLSKAGGSFKIDHPLDPANKYLYHSFVESPDMMNIYNGTVTTDAQGEAVITLPNWFEALNRDFRYQLTCIGGFAPVYVAQEVVNHQFRIAGGVPGMKVSWQVTGVRHDAWADAHRIPVEQLKTGKEHGLYLHPELFGASPEKSVAVAHRAAVNSAREHVQRQRPIK